MQAGDPNRPKLLRSRAEVVLCHEREVFARNFTRDGGRSPGVGMQVQTSNRLGLLRPKAVVVSAEEKAHRMRQV